MLQDLSVVLISSELSVTKVTWSLRVAISDKIFCGGGGREILSFFMYVFIYAVGHCFHLRQEGSLCTIQAGVCVPSRQLHGTFVHDEGLDYNSLRK